jgi:predicted NBD/HSP70 family sugar kinase
VYCSSSAISRYLAAQVAAASDHRSVLSVGSSLADLGSAAEQNDPVASKVIREAAAYLARGLVNLVWNFDPELIVVSGSVIRQCPTLIEATQQAMGSTNAARNMDIPLVAASQGANAGVIAASSIVSVPYLESLA